MTDIVDPTLIGGLTPDETFKKILIPMIRNMLPSMIANDLVGVQPMSGPSGLIFAMKSKYGITASAQDVSGYDEWLQKNNCTDCPESVDIYIEQLVG